MPFHQRLQLQPILLRILHSLRCLARVSSLHLLANRVQLRLDQCHRCRRAGLHHLQREECDAHCHGGPPDGGPPGHSKAVHECERTLAQAHRERKEPTTVARAQVEHLGGKPGGSSNLLARKHRHWHGLQRWCRRLRCFERKWSNQRRRMRKHCWRRQRHGRSRDLSQNGCWQAKLSRSRRRQREGRRPRCIEGRSIDGSPWWRHAHPSQKRHGPRRSESAPQRGRHDRGRHVVS
mmetsp:Transcript_39328/g.91975  ORF Transcript_39328/g.91975 Transcript_39328/m.91975 type:complete len:235 (+) Transcript_39328:957-1661(+)